MAKKRLFDENGNEVKGKIKKPFYKKVWFWAVVVILIGAFGSMGGEDEVAESNAAAVPSEKKVETTEATTEESAPAEEEAAPAVEAYAVGEEVSVGDVTYVVKDIQTATNVGGEFGENSKGTYLIIDISVTNNGSEALTVSDDFFTLLNDGKTYESDATAGIYANETNSFFLESINPDLTMDGKVVFDVSDAVIESSSKQLQVATGFWSTETELINLQ
ncbi:hypothetical protein CAR_c17910 [Carnobacterium sp. 17-4]|uniref:DUF4352 domain-containing protein n=1 Tax=Carnobacterium sp. (strain 17-4) TaxID=208596 RepID=UPI0002058512|nr:DUF4352 domain-containing protein [Carnobacterium sp. 17-4]AEB30449.1 hypothetical protein CAR_c17910 [Carnobacterium sp. 17-4]